MAQIPSEQPPATVYAAGPAFDPPAPERETTRSAPTMSEPSVQSRPAPPTDSPNPDANADANANHRDEHAGHDMRSMSDHNMDHM